MFYENLLNKSQLISVESYTESTGGIGRNWPELGGIRWNWMELSGTTLTLLYIGRPVREMN